MERQERSTLETFRRVQEFLTQHPLADTPADLGEQAGELRDAIARLEAELVEQESSTKYTQVHAKSRQGISDQLYLGHMKPVARIAREVFGVSGMDRAFRMPAANGATQKLINAAVAMAAAAERERATFTRYGRRADFVERLRRAIARLEQARDAKTENYRKRLTATATVKDQVKRGRKAVRMLDAILVPRLAQDPALLTAWRSVKRVRPTTAAGSGEAVSDEDLKVA